MLARGKHSAILTRMNTNENKTERTERAQSELEKLCEAKGISIVAEYDPSRWREDWKDSTPYKVTLKRTGDQRRTLTTSFYCGSAWTTGPSAADVIGCLCSDARSGEMSFEDFCSDFGYDEDSRMAEKTWKACKSMAPRIMRFLGDDFETFANAEH